MPVSPFSQNDERGEKEEADENDGAVAGREEEAHSRALSV